MQVLMCLAGNKRMTESKEHQVNGVQVYTDYYFVLTCSCGSYFRKVSCCDECGKPLVNDKCENYHPRLE